MSAGLLTSGGLRAYFNMCNEIATPYGFD